MIIIVQIIKNSVMNNLNLMNVYNLMNIILMKTIIMNMRNNVIYIRMMVICCKKVG